MGSMLGEPSATHGDAGRGGSRSDCIGVSSQCGAKLCKQQDGEERAVLTCLRRQSQLRQTVSERNVIRM